MLGRVAICLVVMILALVFFSCTKIPELATPGEGNIAFEKLPEKDSIPLKFGNLVSVNHNPKDTRLYSLWFQDEHGNLRLVFYNIRVNQFSTNVRLIPRK